MSTELSIVSMENIDLIISNAPTAYSENTVSRDGCNKFGQELLSKIQQQGMTDELDQQAAVYLERTRKTLKKMNDNRAPLTKLFDQIRSQFTAMEAAIDPTKQSTVPFLIQEERNRFAAKKREEEQARQRELLRKQQMEIAQKEYRNGMIVIANIRCSQHMNTALNCLQDLFNTVTLENYDQRIEDIKKIYETVPDTFTIDYDSIATSMSPNVLNLVPMETRKQVQNEVSVSVIASFQEEYSKSIKERKQYYLDLMPSKRQELQKIAKANAEEAERLKQEMAAREQAEAQRLEAERKKAEEQKQTAQNINSQQATMASLFDNQAAAAAPAAYVPKASVKKKLVPLNVEAFPEIISMWWTHEGCTMSVEELSKMFKKQITFCEKLAKDGTLITSEHIDYQDEVKAK